MSADIIPLERRIAMLKTLREGARPLNPSTGAAPPTRSIARLPEGWFVRGPLPGRELEIVARLPGRALVVWLLIHHQGRLRRKQEITLPAALLAKVGIARLAKTRALRCLEKAGVIAVTWQAGHAPRIRLVGDR
jgi:hypothetical protein